MSSHHKSEQDLFEEETVISNTPLAEDPLVGPEQEEDHSRIRFVEAVTPKTQKRQSFGFRLPVKPSFARMSRPESPVPGNVSGEGSQHSRESSKGSNKKENKGKGKTREGNGSGTVIGMPGFTKVVDGPALLFERTNSKGQVVSTDFWNAATKDMSAQQLFSMLELAKLDNTYELVSFVRAIEYQGFDREFYIMHALNQMTVSVFVRFAILGAVRGSNFAKIKESCEGMPQDLISSFSGLGFVKTPKKRTDLTILRCTASIPQWCLYWMWKAGVTKKVTDSECPAYLQFPGAASLPMSKALRQQHIDFSIKFSSLLPGGKFNVNIYLTAYANMISVNEVPLEVTSLLGISSTAEGRLLSAEEVSTIANTALTSLVKK